jgi:ArsR family transcriptional regulator
MTLPQLSKNRIENLPYLAEVFSALSNPNRLRILKRIALQGEGRRMNISAGACVSEIGQGMGLSPSTISHHLKALKIADLVVADRRGKKIFFRINPRAIDAVEAFFSHALSRDLDGG